MYSIKSYLISANSQLKGLNTFTVNLVLDRDEIEFWGTFFNCPHSRLMWTKTLTECRCDYHVYGLSLSSEVAPEEIYYSRITAVVLLRGCGLTQPQMAWPAQWLPERAEEEEAALLSMHCPDVSVNNVHETGNTRANFVSRAVGSWCRRSGFRVGHLHSPSRTCVCVWTVCSTSSVVCLLCMRLVSSLS